jgi:hypothetical protein
MKRKTKSLTNGFHPYFAAFASLRHRSGHALREIIPLKPYLYLS